MSTPRRIEFVLAAALAAAVVACTPEQSKEVGRIPKKTLDKASADINKAMQQGQGSERLKDADK